MQTVLSMLGSIKVTSFSSQKRAQLLHQINLSKDLFGHSCYLFLELELQVEEEDKLNYAPSLNKSNEEGMGYQCHPFKTKDE